MIYSGSASFSTLDLTLPSSIAAFENATNREKRLFHPKGGGIQFDQTLNGIITDLKIVKNLTINNVGNSTAEITLLMKMPQELCEDVQGRLTGSETEGIITDVQFSNIFGGSVAVTIGAGGICNACSAKPQGCLVDATGNYMHYFSLWSETD